MNILNIQFRSCQRIRLDRKWFSNRLHCTCQTVFRADFTCTLHRLQGCVTQFYQAMQISLEPGWLLCY